LISNRGLCRAWDHLFLSITHHHLGRADKARDYLERGRSQIRTAGHAWFEINDSEALRHSTVVARGALEGGRSFKLLAIEVALEYELVRITVK
jgi:hypothetical protein